MAISGIFTSDSGWAGSRNDVVADRMIRVYKTGSAIVYGLTSGVTTKKTKTTSYSYSEMSPVENRIRVVAMPDLTGLGITFQMEDTTMLHQKHILMNEMTGEQMLVTGVTGDQITVQRGFADTIPQAVTLSAVAQVYFFIMSTAFEEGSTAPNSYITAPSMQHNQVQIFRKGWEVTNTAEAVDDYTHEKPAMLYGRATVEQLAEDIEGAMLWGNLSHNTWDGRPMRTTRGLFAHIKSNRVTIPASGITERALDAIIEKLYRHSVRGYNNERIILASPTVLLTLGELARKRVTYLHRVEDKRYGFQYNEWVTPMGSFKVILHPRFNSTPMYHGTMLAYHPGMFNKRVLRGVQEHKDIFFGTRDTKAGGLITELGAEYAAEQTAMIIDGWFNADLS